MSLNKLFTDLGDVFDGPLALEQHAAHALRMAASETTLPDVTGPAPPLPRPVLEVMKAPDAHPLCTDIAQIPFAWAPPTTSSDPAYIAHSTFKVHVELLGPGGLVHSDEVRLGLYGMLPGSDYGLRTHPAEEVFIMLAGEAFWKRGDLPYSLEGPRGRSYHPSGLAHATRTGGLAFLSVYVWGGDISTTNYVYSGLGSA